MLLVLTLLQRCSLHLPLRLLMLRLLLLLLLRLLLLLLLLLLAFAILRCAHRAALFSSLLPIAQLWLTTCRRFLMLLGIYCVLAEYHLHAMHLNGINVVGAEACHGAADFLPVASAQPPAMRGRGSGGSEGARVAARHHDSFGDFNCFLVAYLQ